MRKRSNLDEVMLVAWDKANTHKKTTSSATSRETVKEVVKTNRKKLWTLTGLITRRCGLRKRLHKEPICKVRHTEVHENVTCLRNTMMVDNSFGYSISQYKLIKGFLDFITTTRFFEL